MRAPLWASLALTLLSLACLALPSRAAAQREEAAEVLLREGYERRQSGDLEGALALFQQAYELHASPRIVAQLGLTEAAMERWLSAERHLELALAEDEDEFIRRRRAALEAAMSEIGRHLGGLSLRGGEAGAEIRIDGQPRGRLPLSEALREVAGVHRLEVLGQGAPFVREVTVEVGQTSEVALPGGVETGVEAELGAETEPRSETDAGAESSSEVAVESEDPSVPPPGAEGPPPPLPGPEPWMPGWILAGAGGAAVLAGAILGALVLDAEAQLLGRCADDGDGDDRLCAPGVMEQESFRALQDRERTMAPAADALLFGGLGLAAVGVALALALASPPEPDWERMGLRLDLGLALSSRAEGGSLWLRGAF